MNLVFANSASASSRLINLSMETYGS